MASSIANAETDFRFNLLRHQVGISTFSGRISDLMREEDRHDEDITPHGVKN